MAWVCLCTATLEALTPPAKSLNQHWAIELRALVGHPWGQPSFLGHVFQYHSSLSNRFTSDSLKCLVRSSPSNNRRPCPSMNG